MAKEMRSDFLENFQVRCRWVVSLTFNAWDLVANSFLQTPAFCTTCGHLL